MTARIIRTVSPVLIAGVLIFAAASSTSEAGNRCTDHCADVYKMEKDACKLIPLKTERKICERRAKEIKEDCKHRCK